MLKIAIPTVEGKLCLHFGHCQKFAFVEVDETEKRILKTEYADAPPHAPGLLPEWLHEREVSVVIAGGMGQRAQMIFAQHGIKLIIGAPPDEPEKVVEAYLNGSLETADNPCDH